MGGLKIEKFVGFEGHISELGEPSSVSKRGVQNIRTKNLEEFDGFHIDII